jgi:hypothetical protein
VIAGILCALDLTAQRIEVENAVGGVAVRASMGEQPVEVRAVSSVRPQRSGDVRFARRHETVTVRCEPEDGIAMDLELAVPHTSAVRVNTKHGAIADTGSG